MSLISRKGLLERVRRNKETRDRLVSNNLAEGIAFQIAATRNAREWTQADLAGATGMSQNNISRVESPDYGKQTISSLKKIAAALDVALVVRFVPFSQYIDWLSGTPHLDPGLRPQALTVPSFEDEERGRVFDAHMTYWSVSEGARPSRSWTLETRRLPAVATSELRNGPVWSGGISYISRGQKEALTA